MMVPTTTRGRSKRVARNARTLREVSEDHETEREGCEREDQRDCEGENNCGTANNRHFGHLHSGKARAADSTPRGERRQNRVALG